MDFKQIDVNVAKLISSTKQRWNFRMAKKGGLAASVSNCDVNVSNVTILHHKAVDRSGASRYASISLDEIANYDGNLIVLDGF